jgi:hypothetical protein
VSNIESTSMLRSAESCSRDRAVMIRGVRHDPLAAMGNLARIEVIRAGLAIRFLLGTAARS